MKIIHIGATGVVGRGVLQLLQAHHDVIVVGHNDGDYTVDLCDRGSIAALFSQVGLFDALIVTAGHVHFAPLDQMDHFLYEKGIKHKLLGQVELVLQGVKTLRDGGSFTLISGILAHDPIRSGSSAAMVNGAIESFVKAAAIELPRGCRINAVSPTILQESVAAFGSLFAGFKPVSAEDVARAYQKSVEGHQTGQIYQVL